VTRDAALAVATRADIGNFRFYLDQPSMRSISDAFTGRTTPAVLADGIALRACVARPLTRR
jgi:hypothetical protein